MYLLGLLTNHIFFGRRKEKQNHIDDIETSVETKIYNITSYRDQPVTYGIYSTVFQINIECDPG